MSIVPILLATHNQGKAQEFQEMLGEEWHVLTAQDVPHLPQVIEDGDTFEANARKKALSCSEIFQGYVLADDSGLQVDSLNGAPGIYSARFAGEPSNDSRNNALLLKKLDGLPRDQRGAQFVCTLALAQGSEILGVFDGVLRGHVLQESRGQAGFGYDPLFVPDNFDESLAELGSGIKHQISHRSQALKKLAAFLRRTA